MAGFEPEKLLVFRVALDFAEQAELVAARLPAAQYRLAAQLRGASQSVVLNISEGAGEFLPREKRRFYRIARRSGTECLAIYRLIHRLQLVPHPATRPGEALLDRLLAMLTSLTKPQ